MWRIINEISGTLSDKSSIIDHITIDAIDYFQPKQIANEFGKYFRNIGKKFANKIPKSLKSMSTYLEKIRQNSSSLFMNPCTTYEIKMLINSLPNKTSSGHDDISNKLLKEICEPLLPALDYIVNESLKLGIFPTVMKLAEVVPLFKSGKSEIVGNYRPISLLMTISKVLEKVVYNQVYRFLTDTGQIYECQYGFRSHHSCEHAIGQLVAHVIKNLELKKDTISVFLDLSKAFNSLQHDIILKKMERYGLCCVTLSWFKSYLENRKLRAKCRTAQSGQVIKSDIFLIDYGTPQGSCLGPLIFLIFCNDLSLHLQFLECIQFADDTTLVYSHANKHYLRFCIIEDLLSIQDWFYANKLTLNLSKTVYLFFEHKCHTNIDLDLTLNGITIPKKRHTKFLGVWVDDQLNWKHHMQKLTT